MVRLGVEVTKAERTSVGQAALKAKTIHVGFLRQATGGDLRMSGVGRNGTRVNARYDTTRAGNAVVYARGPVHLLERPSKPHEIIVRSKQRRRRSYSGAKALGVPGRPVAKVQHPGVRNPKRPWSRGAAAARPVIERTIRRQYGTAFARAMRG